MKSKSERTDDELANFRPTLGKTWDVCGFVSLNEFKRWSAIRSKQHEAKYAERNRLTYVDKPV